MTIQFVCNGRVMPAGQNRLSNVAYQYTSGLHGNDRRIGKEALTKLLAKLGVSDPTAAPWSVELPNGVEVSCVEDGKQPKSTPKPKASRKAAAAPKQEAAKANGGPRKVANTGEHGSPKAAAKKAGAASAPLKKPPAPRRRLAAVPSA